jgi:hypothetical protein
MLCAALSMFPQLGVGLGDTQTQEAERGLGEDAATHGERGVDEDGTVRVAQQVPDGDDQSVHTDRWAARTYSRLRRDMSSARTRRARPVQFRMPMMRMTFQMLAPKIAAG